MQYSDARDAGLTSVALMASIKSIMQAHDLHIVVNGSAQKATCFAKDGTRRWQIPARTWGQHSDWRKPQGDTPPGLYVCGTLYETAGEAAYGPWCIDLIDLEGQETDNGRAGICIHGGGSSLPDPFAPYQGWRNTYGCVRTQNHDLVTHVVPALKAARAKGGKVYVTVVL